MAKVRRLKKSVKLSFLILLVVFVLGILNFTGNLNPYVIQGYFTLDKETTVQDENIITFFINSTAEGLNMGSNEFRVYQKYQVGKDSACVRDCMAVCEAGDFNFNKAYSQQWGVCRCKCEKV